jgi:putative FmdB family regulatory protein
MPVYEFYCPTCSTKFEKLVSLSATGLPVACAAGHVNTRKLISVFAVGNRAGEEQAPFASGGGCACGGACSCGGH